MIKNNELNNGQNYQDFNLNGIMRFLPYKMQAYYLLARLDRPAGWQMLYVPCCFGLALGLYELSLGLGSAVAMHNLIFWLFGFLCGAIAMRTVGCIWNDILDRNIDKNVARTKHRPLASGAISVQSAVIFALFWLALGFAFFLNLPIQAQITALAILPVVAIYPLMKRIMVAPQLILGLVFNWGILCGYSAITGNFPHASVWLLWLGGIFWTLCYDTIYACQDKNFDKNINVKSFALFLGDAVKKWVGLFYMIFLLCYGVAFWLVGGLLAIQMLAVTLLLMIVMLILLYRVDIEQPKTCLKFFKRNGVFGFACFIVSLLPLVRW
ncbi:MAG: UbiA family prenyltransferase [Alphaproteobacteria bacterium]|nr:UbiA family prenyltransferase [Alphaproteobacteria bacterium]